MGPPLTSGLLWRRGGSSFFTELLTILAALLVYLGRRVQRSGSVKDHWRHHRERRGRGTVEHRDAARRNAVLIYPAAGLPTLDLTRGRQYALTCRAT
jgi:hypothetical protein